jgi:steroid 5-alpha reductase family enzyme
MFQEFFPVLEGVPMGDLWVLLAWGLLFMMVWMFLLWLWHFKLQNAGVVDFGWASGLMILGIFYAVKADGYTPRRWLIGMMVGLWGGRLAWHLLKDRILGDKPEDARYATLRARWETHLGIKFFFFFQLQAIVAVFLSIPFALLSVDSLDRITGFEWLGLLIWVMAFLGEVMADAQLKQFKADPDNEGHVCQGGLWYYSRHPNYFFEWLIWVAYFVAALESDYGIWTVVCPLLMLYFFLRVTGIPATEEHALESRGEEYAEYQQTTSRFIPWFKKSGE